MMNANPKLWQFICAVIVLIAVQFSPALARAHADQAHRLQGHVHVHHHAVPHGAHAPVAHHLTKAAFTKDVFAEADFTKASLAETIGSIPHELILTAGRPPGAAPIDADGCVDGCCGAGMGCCGGAALVAASQCLPPAVHSHRLDVTGAVLASGIEPASLRKPPRALT
ncbi:hypothetical protein JQ597_03800 [Bradyrhizobium sp. AUGA SZCCT0177]|uniref:hypothetical protein n=1 Tax=unclassified Bradyrhizobium TaxID=2631580 RepID=UPI001BA940DB|nr:MULTISPECIES: hypothetical protein [unclassified Bradyrhizobium]MBR1232502.1 hypothetical protein [Bradyrhizobium sp. AUGA SZCCT0182]MBR1281157.1 hypothetical protein [Bradyrhizobium sp. AUGA SZCCT0177]